MAIHRLGLILQHGDSGPPGILGEWLRERAIAHQIHPTWRESLPADPVAYGWIAFGFSPMPKSACLSG